MKSITVIAGFLATFLLSSLIGLGQTQSRSDLLKELQAKRGELEALEKGFLDPGEEDRALYSTFLNQPETGLIRLLPRARGLIRPQACADEIKLDLLAAIDQLPIVRRSRRAQSSANRLGRQRSPSLEVVEEIRNPAIDTG